MTAKEAFDTFGNKIQTPSEEYCEALVDAIAEYNKSVCSHDQIQTYESKHPREVGSAKYIIKITAVRTGYERN